MLSTESHINKAKPKGKRGTVPQVIFSSVVMVYSSDAKFVHHFTLHTHTVI